MDDVQTAIARVISSFSFTWEYGTTMARLAFLVEFPNYCSKGVLKQVFVHACSKTYHPSGSDLEPLMAYPSLIALMMQYREGIIQPEQAVWNKKAGPFSFGDPPAPATASASATTAAFVGLFGTTTASATTTASVPTPTPAFTFGSSPALGTAEDKWLDERFKSLGLA